MNTNYEFIFFQYLYEVLELKVLDEKLLNEKIKMIDQEGSNNRISKYFSLVSRGDVSYFSEDNKKTYTEIFDKELNDILSNNKERAIDFIKATYKDYFHLNDKIEYNYYGPINEDFLAPSNCIVIGLNYVKYQIDNDNFDEELFRQDGIICDTLNYLQGPLAEEKGFNIAALAYNEITLSQPFVRL